MTGTNTKTKKQQDVELNKMLEQSFPASDPPSPNEVDETPVRPIGRKPAIIEKGPVEALAKEAELKNRTRTN